ncbi:hypothetical protein CYMTET_29600 [Cymbomonas tetramitiformis]|uniref:2-dehydropantoate 2-reductase n=1 Tax=Cymbomonas tetramitiformis TaxID=36881 RepID=A0AAE0FKQ2_9CHLO|nr:hypothetical protein CYMTET_29600 [Cymbomonas tetramitiformis]
MPVETNPATGTSSISLGNVCIFGAGCIGCFVGICLAGDGQKVTFLHRKSNSGESFLDKVSKTGIRLKDHYGKLNKHLDASTCASAFTLDCERALRDADVILVATKRVANEEVSLRINQFAKKGVPIVTLQNGTFVRKQLAPFLNADHPIIECMVNVAVVTTPEGFAKTSPIARFVLDGDPETLAIAERVATAFKSAGVRAEVDADIKAVQYGKLLFILQKNILDDTAHSSMWEDFKYGRTSEIDFLNGEIVRLGKDFQVPTPYNDKLVRNVKQHEEETGGLSMVSATMMATMIGVQL